MIDEQLVLRLLLFAVVVLCAWAYPRLNHWVYRRRIAGDTMAAGQGAAPPAAAGLRGRTRR